MSLTTEQRRNLKGIRDDAQKEYEIAPLSPAGIAIRFQIMTINVLLTGNADGAELKADRKLGEE